MRTIWMRALFVAFVLLLVGSAVSAQEREGGRVFLIDPNPAPAEPGGVGTELVSDGGFEAGTPNPFWTETSTNFGTPLCDVPSCGMGGGTGPYGGSWWAWFGGIAAPETGSVSQTVAGGAADSCQLTFFLEIPVASGNGVDFMDVEIGGQNVFSVTEADSASYSTYTQVSVDVSSAIDGTNQIFEFNSTITGSATTNFFVDDVSLVCQAPVPTMSGWAVLTLVALILVSGMFLLRRRVT